MPLFLPLWVIFLSTFFLPVYLFGTPRQAGYVAKVWGHGVIIALRLFHGIRYEIRGLEHLPPEPFIVASKHQSAWDTAIFHIILNRPVFVLKKELTRIPFFGPYLTRMGMIPVDREGQLAALKDMVAQSKNRLEDKRSIVIFPEGTRTKPGERVTYHPGVAALYTNPEINVPVVPAALNSGLYWPKKGKKHKGTIVLEFLPPIMPGMKRKEFLPLLEQQIEEVSGRLNEEAGV
jgi:1-acyl-sn-glycerol-3-phosphate acyltransferase